MNHPIIPQNGEENDTFSRYWRRCYCYLSRAGTTARIKRQYRRRVRKFLETEIINERKEYAKGEKRRDEKSLRIKGNTSDNEGRAFSATSSRKGRGDVHRAKEKEEK